jgi:hypothetical protein
MTISRTTARGALLLIAAALLGAAAVAAQALAAAPRKAKLPQIVFPVLGGATFVDDFGDPRGSRAHEGNDLMAPKRALAIAAEGGTVRFHTTSANAGCMLYLDGDSGTQYLYIHLNNDLTKGNDNRGTCVPGVAYAPGLKDGDRVEAGEPVGFVGDSGDADGIASHLHFEVHPNGGAPVSPYKLLKAAPQLLFAAKLGTTFTLALTGKVVSVGAGTLTLDVTRVRSWPGGRLIPQQGGRTVTITVPQTTPLGAVLVKASAPSRRALSSAGLTVTVWTAPAPVTPEAQAGAPGVLVAARVEPR